MERANARHGVPTIQQESNTEFRDGGHGARAPLPTLRNRARYFGCGTMRIYGFGDFQPCG
jgi:hypothetical protein